MQLQLTYALAALLGALLQEVAHWHELKTNLDQENYKHLLRSLPYWVITVLMILLSGIGTVVWFWEDPQDLRTYLLVGAAFPVILKKAVASFAGDAAQLGKSPTRQYFQIQ